MSEKLSCGIARDLMPLVIDDVAGEESKRAVEAHLAECAECSRIYETLKQPDPIPARDEQDRLHFRQSMKRVSRRGMAVRIIAVCLAIVILACGITVAANPDMLLSVYTDVPVEWMQNACLVRSAQGIVMLRFTPSEKYRAFYGSSSLSGTPSESGAEIDWTIAFTYPQLARAFDIKLSQEKVAEQRASSKELIQLPNGDWLVPITVYFPWYYDEEEDCLVQVDRFDASAEQISELVQKGIPVTGSTQIAMLDYSTTAESFSVIGNGKQATVYTRGDEIPLLDDEAQALFDLYLEMNPYYYDLRPGDIFTELKG